MKFLFWKRRGYVTLMSVLVLGAVSAAIAITLILIGLSASRGSFTRLQSARAKAMVDGCAEEALQQIRSATAFTGTGSLVFGSSTCVYGVTNTGGQTRHITATSTTGTVIRKLDIVVSAINPRITISGWQEVP